MTASYALIGYVAAGRTACWRHYWRCCSSAKRGPAALHGDLAATIARRPRQLAARSGGGLGAIHLLFAGLTSR
ncbi:MAG: hypothetical protein R3E65_05250 [Steroidobacteraceae bacterium]